MCYNEGGIHMCIIKITKFYLQHTFSFVDICDKNVDFYKVSHCANTPLNDNMRHLWNFIFIFFVVLIVSVHCQSVSHVRKLYVDLFSNYTKEAMPMYDHSKLLRVGVTFYLNSINSFKEVEETISIAGSFIFNWTDSFLTWNPSLYGNVYWTVIDSSDMWVLCMVLINNVNKMEPIGGETKCNAFILPNGEVVYTPGDVFEAKCPTNISKFPFDD